MAHTPRPCERSAAIAAPARREGVIAAATADPAAERRSSSLLRPVRGSAPRAVLLEPVRTGFQRLSRRASTSPRAPRLRAGPRAPLVEAVEARVKERVEVGGNRSSSPGASAPRPEPAARCLRGERIALRGLYSLSRIGRENVASRSGAELLRRADARGNGRRSFAASPPNGEREPGRARPQLPASSRQARRRDG